MSLAMGPSGASITETKHPNILAMLRIQGNFTASRHRAPRTAQTSTPLRRQECLLNLQRSSLAPPSAMSGKGANGPSEPPLPWVPPISNSDLDLPPENGTANPKLASETNLTNPSSSLSPSTGQPLPPKLPPAPWTISTTITVMACWIICFYFAAYDIVPFLLHALGYTSGALSLPAVQALRHLLLDTLQLSMTLLLLHRALSSHTPRAHGLFSLQFFPLRSWIPTVTLGAAAFPIIDFVHKQMVALLSNAATQPSLPSTNTAFAATATWQVQATWFVVLAICAPLWEEIMFRGFLIPSLARYLAPGWAVAASSLVFATVHFTKEGFVPLLMLGGVFGAAYLKTMNLLPAIVLHSFWNICLLTQILMIG